MYLFGPEACSYSRLRRRPSYICCSLGTYLQLARHDGSFSSCKGRKCGWGSRHCAIPVEPRLFGLEWIGVGAKMALLSAGGNSSVGLRESHVSGDNRRRRHFPIPKEGYRLLRPMILHARRKGKGPTCWGNLSSSQQRRKLFGSGYGLARILLPPRRGAMYLNISLGSVGFLSTLEIADLIQDNPNLSFQCAPWKD
ncbi:hypothetical protein BJY01DRAFT_76818 [Aspergillus pseudoustus]|uniref:Uncharacterized protein n=1 Tax=Aspergillus pseudoustus TaxID=1810923 RepID=A0ABR4J6E7_9EURO